MKKFFQLFINFIFFSVISSSANAFILGSINEEELNNYFPTPISGIWWTPSNSGVGYSIDVHNGVLALSVYTYNSDGSPQWYFAAGQLENNKEWKAQLQKYANGSCLGCTFKENQALGSVGTVSIKFIENDYAVIRYPNGSEYYISPIFTSRPEYYYFHPKPGLWWNPAESGTGYAIDIRNDNAMFITAYSYNSDGSPQWFAGSAVLNEELKRWEGQLNKYNNGTCPGCAFKPNQYAGSTEKITIEFSDRDTGVMAFANGKRIPIQSFFPAKPSYDGPTLLQKLPYQLGPFLIHDFQFKVFTFDYDGRSYDVCAGTVKVKNTSPNTVHSGMISFKYFYKDLLMGRDTAGAELNKFAPGETRTINSSALPLLKNTSCGNTNYEAFLERVTILTFYR